VGEKPSHDADDEGRGVDKQAGSGDPSAHGHRQPLARPWRRNPAAPERIGEGREPPCGVMPEEIQAADDRQMTVAVREHRLYPRHPLVISVIDRANRAGRCASMVALIKVTAHLGYLVLFGLVGAESAGVPVPGETALITAGVLAHHGRFNIELVIVIAASAAIVGDNVGYLIGRTGGRRLLERPGFLERHRRQLLRKGEPFFERHGPKAVFLGRWVAGLRIAAAWLAGISRMPWPVFLFWNALGGIAWATSVGLLAYYLGPTAEHIFKVTGLAGVALALVIAAAYLVWRWRRNKHEPELP
jgi:undecaprenyl-diphosphatase